MSFFILNAFLITNKETVSTLERKTTGKAWKNGLVLEKNPLQKILSRQKKSKFSWWHNMCSHTGLNVKMHVQRYRPYDERIEI